MNVKEKVWNGISRSEYFTDGQIKELTFEEKNEIETLYGMMIPRYKHDEARKKYTSSISFYNSGEVKRISLEDQMPIETPIGIYPAECVIFYPSGKLKRFFPLNGKVSGYWSEEDEKSLSEISQFRLSVGSFRTHMIGASFYESGLLKSFTIWSGEDIVINTNSGLFPVRIGFSLYEDGSIKSLEPAYPIPIVTPIGNVTVYDKNAIGIESDDNSLKFDQDGNIIGFTTSQCSIMVFGTNREKTIIKPLFVPSMMNDEVMVKVPLKISIKDEFVIIDDGKEIHSFDQKTDRFVVRNEASEIDTMKDSCTGTDCSSCNICS